MKSHYLIVSVAALAVAVSACQTPAERAAVDIAAKNAAARGGLEAWAKVKAISMSGTLDAGTPRDPVKLAMSYTKTQNDIRAEERRIARMGVQAAAVQKQVQLPFVMDLERPRKSRIEIQYQGQTAVQVYDGSHGWKLRPFLGRHEVESFGADELRLAKQQSDLDGPLLDWKAQGSRLALVGTQKVDGHDAYDLAVTLRDGQVRHVWVDTESYLDVQIDGSRKLDGKFKKVWTAQRDFRAVDGLMIPHKLETTVDGVHGVETISIENVSINPMLDDTLFRKPD